jgi:signal peptidase I
MNTPAQVADPPERSLSHLPLHLPTVAEAFASLLRTVIVALFLLTFVLQPYLIPSESMEHTLLVGDFLLVNKQAYAPAGSLSRLLLPYREVARGDIVIFHDPRIRGAFTSSGSWVFRATGCALRMAV